MNRSFLILLIFFISALTNKVWASHIVGGELEMSKKRGGFYQISLKMYVDDLNADPGVILSETQATIGIFDRLTNAKIGTAILPRISNIGISYGTVCAASSIPVVKTRLLTFSASFLLDPNVYNSPGGYYMSWENCCRNNAIINIDDPYSEGMVFYLEFPALSVNNSSPNFTQLKGDYPCLNKPFTYDFSGTDVNDDSLVYSITTPLAGSYDPLNPSVSSAPYDSVVWMPGYGRTNQIPGTPPFSINSQTGEVFFTPTVLGLFVFAVKVDEYRNGIKIGSSRRDFQLRVVNCEVNASNSIALEYPDGTIYNSSTDTLFLDIENDTCFTVLAADSNTIKYNQTENLSVFLLNTTLPPGIVSFSSSLVVTPAIDTTSTNLCFAACNKIFIEQDSVFTLSLMVTDAPKCPQGLAYYDTLNLVIVYKAQTNQRPTIGTIPVLSSITATIGKQIYFDVYGEDQDAGDLISINAQGEGFSLVDKGMLFTDVSGTDSIGSRFRWVPQCRDLETKERLRVLFIVKDNSCDPTNKDTVLVDIYVKDTSTSITQISPTNLFTPNGDGMNDYFEIPNIPEGNCEFYFKKISIYNRWGSKVYENNSTNFKWSGDKNPSGVYYYVVDINNKEFRGWVEMVR